MLYKNQNDPQIDKDLETKVLLHEKFEKKWKNDDSYLTDEKMLLKALQDWEKLCESPKKSWWYLEMLSVIDSKNEKVTAKLSKVREVLTTAQNRTLFFELKVAAIDPSVQKVFLESALLKPYKYTLERTFMRSKYLMSEPEERITSRLLPPAYGNWVEGVQKILARQTIVWKGNTIGLGQAAWLMPTLLKKSDRQKIYSKIKEAVRPVENFAESEINAICNTKKILDESRGYPHPYSEMIFDNQNDEAQTIKLVKTITDHFPIAHRFYRLKKKLLGITGPLTYVDVSARIGTVKKSFEFNAAADIVNRSFGHADPIFSRIFEEFLSKGQIDVFPKVGKQSGAFCASETNVPTFVMLNHVPSLDGVKTLAHEMGHAIHAELSKDLPVLYQGHTLSTAETASTLFENFAFEQVFETLSDKEKIIALHDSIQGSIATVFRQIAAFNFERDLHDLIRQEGYVPEEKISALLNKNILAYVGKEFKFDADDGKLWIRWSHFRSPFYVYTYAYGELVSKAMYAKYKEDKSFVEKIKQFLRAGGSKSPEDIFKDIGIDTSKEAFWVAGLKTIEDDIIALEKLVGFKGKK